MFNVAALAGSLIESREHPRHTFNFLPCPAKGMHAMTFACNTTLRRGECRSVFH